mmetsp:Transcript_23140/g.72579  ORF Transcript_23140/g.72579 Transcript_23140/m.72579 type:complete len:91 (+) Transcript_23140:600-872(+)
MPRGVCGGACGDSYRRVLRPVLWWCPTLAAATACTLTPDTCATPLPTAAIPVHAAAAAIPTPAALFTSRRRSRAPCHPPLPLPSAGVGYL